MEALKFTLSGRNAFFKKPEVNSNYYFTYGQIHKIALLGLFGAVRGYGGYAQKKWTKKKKSGAEIEEYPEFYERLHDLHISILPGNEKGYIPKKVQLFNNSVGYASKEQGGNLIIKEQWLENPQWDIYVLLDCEEAELLKEDFLAKRCIYMPYLGKNDHPADLKNIKVVSLEVAEETELVVSSLFPKNIGKIVLHDDEDEDEEIESFKYEEKLPIALNGYTNLYEYETFCYTNLPLCIKERKVYRDQSRILVFY